jgi:NTP pyrophosphatase (non-canonical NTP hydrolase)
LAEEAVTEAVPSVVLSGSFRRHLSEIHDCIGRFEAAGVRVLAPRAAPPKNPGEEFVVLESDDSDDPRTLEQGHLDAIARADALYLVSVGGYVGASASMEIGWALARGKRVFALEAPDDVTLSCFVERVAPPEAVAEVLAPRSGSPLDALHPASPLPEIQRVSRQLVVQRGFADETALEIVLLMVEEVGELAKAVRKEIGLKIDVAKAGSYSRMRTEIADVFIYVLHLAESYGIDLFEAYVEKERKNDERFFARAEEQE